MNRLPMNSAIDPSPWRRATSAWPFPAAAPAVAQRPAAATTRELRKGETLTLDQPQGQAVLCSHGALWITCEPARADDGSMRLQVRALTDACVSVVPASLRPGAGAP
ncbi:MAG: DUF2917 domain-containing protein [Burkholderiales bacterium]|nr:DUF2917 domain-containing protein [Burkholderiales bacterium]MDE2277327.1 DUF2917 domain-containing protein [Burkholderiales bacterium]